MQYFCGIDIGASAAKLVLIDENCELLAKVARRSGVNYSETADACLHEALADAGLTKDHLSASFSTGYGRHNVPWADGNMTEIACHGRGAHFNFQEPITVIDIGAQDSKVIHLDADGRRVSFKMNRKCAAGTGSFLDEIALRLDLPLEELNGLTVGIFGFGGERGRDVAYFLSVNKEADPLVPFALVVDGHQEVGIGDGDFLCLIGGLGLRGHRQSRHCQYDCEYYCQLLHDVFLSKVKFPVNRLSHIWGNGEPVILLHSTAAGKPPARIFYRPVRRGWEG